jgi:hypothetical protein
MAYKLKATVTSVKDLLNKDFEIEIIYDKALSQRF